MVLCYGSNQTYSAAGYRKLMLSHSVTLMMEPKAQRGLLHDMQAFIEADFGGGITRPLVVTLTTATLG